MTKIYKNQTKQEEGFLFPEHEWDYVDKAVDRVKLAWFSHHHMNSDGKPMLLAFSGGKDSICLFFVCKRASEELGIPMEQMFHVQYNITCVDPPELVRFIRDVMKTEYPFIELHHPKKTMWKLIVEKKMPPTRLVRYCCSELKETSHVKSGYTLTGVRHAESLNRQKRGAFEIVGRTKKDVMLLNDNDADRRSTEFCMMKNAYICNPIIDWSDEDVWKFIRGNKLPYCHLYDEGWSRLGCLLCPMKSQREREREIARYPKYAECYKRAFQRMIDAYPEKKQTLWKDGEDAFHWWIFGEGEKRVEQSETLF